MTFCERISTEDLLYANTHAAPNETESFFLFFFIFLAQNIFTFSTMKPEVESVTQMSISVEQVYQKTKTDFKKNSIIFNLPRTSCVYVCHLYQAYLI